MSSGLDMSLDDLIKKSKSRPKANPASSSGPARRAPHPARAAPYPPAAPKARAAADSPYGVYSEHIATIAAVAPPPPPAAATARSLETGTKLHISNLDPGVTVEDVQELFSEVGELKRYSMNYDKDGRSKGTAEVVFARKVDALDAIKRYNGVLLDGKPMNLELIGNNVEPPPMPPLIPNRPLQNYNDIHSSTTAKHIHLCLNPKEVVSEEHLKATVGLDAAVKAVVAVDRGKAEGWTGIAPPFLLQILTLNLTSTMQQQ